MSALRIPVSVTQADIAHGRRYDLRNHPVVSAVNRALGRSDGFCQFPDRVSFDASDDSPQMAARCPHVMLPPTVLRWVMRYDGGLPVRAIKFTVAVEANLMPSEHQCAAGGRYARLPAALAGGLQLRGH